MNSLTLYLVKNKLAILLFALTCLSCKRPQPSTELVVVAVPVLKTIQGVKGKVIFKEGEFSSSGEMLKNGKAYGIEREILFYELTNLKDVEIGEGDFVKYIATEIVDSITSDKYGNFTKELPEGEYSIFIKESNRLYSKLEDGNLYIPITVRKGSSENVIIEVDYKAVYMSGQ